MHISFPGALEWSKAESGVGVGASLGPQVPDGAVLVVTSATWADKNKDASTGAEEAASGRQRQS